MQWFTVSLLVLAAVALVIQSVGLRRQAGKGSAPRSTAAMTQCGTAVVIVAAVLFDRGIVVLSPDLGVILAQGPFGRLGIMLLLIGSATTAALALHSSLLRRGHARHLVWVIVVGAIVGFGSAAATSAVNASGPSGLRIYVYDLWLPFLPLWIMGCLTECALGIWQPPLSTRIYVQATPIAAFALWATHRATAGYAFANDAIPIVWMVVLGSAILLFVWSGTQVLLARLGWSGRGWRTLVRVGVPVAVIVVIVLAGAAWTPRFWVAALVVLAAVLLAGQVWRRTRAGTLLIPDFGRPGRLDDVAVAFALVCLTLSLLDIFNFARFDPVTDLTVFAIASVGLLVLVAGAPLPWFPRERASTNGADAPRRTASGIAGDRISSVWEHIIGLPKAVFPENDKWFHIALKVVLGVVVIVALGEIPNAGQTIVYPFLLQPPDKDAPDRGRIMTERLLNELGRLRGELDPYVLTLTAAEATVVGKVKGGALGSFARPQESGSGGEMQLGISELAIPGGLKVPVRMIVEPVQEPVRFLLGVRQITPVYQQDNDKKVLFAMGNDGSSWRVSTADHAHASPASVCDGVHTPAAESVDTLEDKLAFQILVDTPGISSLGMTQSWAAFDAFREGRHRWAAFEGDEPDALTDAIEYFRCATRLDPSFALAGYWLGRAFDSDGQPQRAIAAMRTVVENRTDYAPAYIALANSLYARANNLYALASSLTANAGDADAAEAQADRREAIQLWSRALLLPSASVSVRNRAAAYAGLCRAAIDDHASHRDIYAGYYGCARAEALLRSLPGALRESADVRTTRAVVLADMAEALQKAHREAAEPPADVLWRCMDNVTFHSPYAAGAARYYDRALELQPTALDIRCHAAMNAVARRDSGPMRELAREAAAHAGWADRLAIYLGHEAPVDDYKLAVEEYERALEVDPMNANTLNSLAYAVWQWRLYHWSDEPDRRPPLELLHKAEDYARVAVRLVSGRSRVMEGMMRDTLASVLLAQARPDEALEEFKEIAHKDMLPKHPQYDEIRWDYMQAYLCAAEIERKRSGRVTSLVRSYQMEAKKLADVIDKNQRYREQPTYVAQWLNQYEPLAVCAKTPTREGESDQRSAAAATYELRKVSYGPAPTCNWLGLQARITGRETDPDVDFKLHVWGGGIHETVDVSTRDRSEAVRLSQEPRETRQYYFVELQDGKGNPLSEVNSIPTLAGCGRNLVSVTYTSSR